MKPSLVIGCRPYSGQIGAGDRLERPRVPQRAPETVGPGRGAGLGEPVEIGLAALGGVDDDIAVLVTRLSRAHVHSLVPALHPRDRVGLDGESEVLMHAGVVPPDPLGVGIRGRVVLHALRPAEGPGGTVVVDDGESVAPRARLLLLDPPAAHVVRGGDDARADALGPPGGDNEVPDARRHPDESVLGDAESLGVARVDPERVPVGDLVQPLGVGRSGVDERRNPEGGEQDALGALEVEVLQSLRYCLSFSPEVQQ